VIAGIRLYKKYLIPVIIALWYIVVGAAPGIQFLQPHLEGFHPLDEGPAAITPLNAEHPAILELKTNLFYDKENIDFEKRQMTFSRVDSLGFTMWEYHFSEMSDYLSSRRNFVIAKSWYRDVASAKRETDAKKQERSLKMQWELPVQYPSWAQRILGNEPPRLTIDGNLTITMGFDRSRYQEGNEKKESQSKTNDFGFDINYQFGIQGTVGKLINVGIRVADNEVASDNNFKNFKIEYKESTPGEMEDEIIQEVIAGWTNFDMPGTELSGYAGGKDGLFGIKIKSKLGPLTLTTIASQEKGEAQKLNLSLKNGGSEKLIAAGDYRRNVFFFLDTLYRNYYNKNWGKSKSTPGYVTPPHVDSLEVYLLQENYQNDQVQSLYDRKDEKGLPYKFIKLIPDRHYELFKDEGYIRFDTTINNDNMVAIYLRTSDPTLNKGIGDTVWTLKPRTQIYEAKEDPARFYLMWRNVYDLDTSQMASFELKLRRYVEGEKDTSLYEPTGNMLLSEVLKLSSKDGKPLIDTRQIYDKEHEFIIVPPYGECPTCNEPFNNPQLGDKYLDPIIYRYSPESQEWKDHKNIYTFKTTGTQKITSLNLGWQVMSGSELVKTSSGEKLEKDVDYIIDYESGTLELISPRALAADNVDVTFQQEAMFVPESKVFLGVRGEMALPFLSEKSFAGISLLFQNAGTNEIPRLEQEPYSKLLIDMNLKAEFEPEWMTWLINKIPLVKTEQTSSVVLEVEAANSRTNPNTNDEAFVDDFEDSRRTYPLGSSHESWSKASPPQYILYSRPGDSLQYDTIRVDSLLPKYPPAFDWFWFQPRASEESPIKQKVWKPTTTKKMSGENDYDPILRLHCQPSPKADNLKSRFYKSWAGIMTPISQSSTDRSRDKYFEFCMNKRESKGRKLIIQMGVLNEDVSWNGGFPNKRGDREDTTLAGTGTKELDKGLDRVWDKDEKYYYPNSTQDGWDSLGYGNDTLGERFKLDPGKDNARDGVNGREYENDKQEALRWRACRQQWNDRYEREDLNYDGTVQILKNEKYYEFVLDLDSMEQYIDSTARVYTENGWAKYRIPIHEISHIRHAINNPSWTNIQMVRIIWTDFDTTSISTESSLWFSDLQFTGNYWIAQSDTNSTTRAEAVSLSNQEDEYYKLKSNTGLIHHEIMPGTKNDFESESALKILFDDVESHDTAMVRKVIPFTAMDVSQYEKLSLVYFGDKEYVTFPENQGLMFGGQVEFVFRFGNNDSTYYEYHNVIKRGEWNFADIDLQVLAELKDDYLVRRPGTKIDTSSGNYRVYSNRVGVEPSLTKISWMALGIRNNSASKKVSGTIWVNEMKVRGIHKLNGWAARASLKTKWADFFNFDASANFNQGDFRTMSETGYAARESKFSGSVSGSMSLDRFLPKDLGVSVPVGGSVASDITRPELKTGSDMRLQSDGVYGMVVDALHVMSDDKKTENVDDVSKSEQYGKKTFRGTVYTNYGKSSQSENPIVNMTADRISTSVNYSKSISTSNMGLAPSKDQIYKIRDENDDYTAKLGYDLTPRDNPTWRPFEKNEKKWAEKFKNYELALLPSTFKFNLADLTYGKSSHSETEKAVFNRSYRYNLNHSVNMNYSPISPLLSFDYSLNVNRDLFNRINDSTSLQDKIKMAFNRDQNGWDNLTVLNGEKTRNQTVSMKLSPDLISWLTTDASYSSAFTSNMVTRLGDKNLYSNSSVHPQFSFNSTLQLESVFDKLADTTKYKTTGRFFGKLKNGYNKIGFRSISFNYTSDMSLRNDYLNKQYMDANKINFFDYFRYQAGFSGRDFRDVINGTMDDRRGLGGMKNRQSIDGEDLYRNDTRSTDRKLTISTGLNFTVPFELSLSPISFEFGDHVGIQAKDTAFYDSSRTYPKFQIGANTPALIKIKLIKQYFSSMTCNSSYNFERIANWSSAPKFSDAVRHTFRPLISISGQIAKTPISINYSCDKSSEHQRMGTGSLDSLINSETTDKKVDHTFTINYEIQKNSRLSEIKLFSWTIPVSGKTTVSFKGNVSKEIAKKREGDKTDQAGKKDEWEPTNDLFSFALSPKITYVFTDNINGEGSWEIGWKKNNDNKTTTNKFAIIINIRL
jgi:hypothetical protein